MKPAPPVTSVVIFSASKVVRPGLRRARQWAARSRGAGGPMVPGGRRGQREIHPAPPRTPAVKAGELDLPVRSASLCPHERRILLRNDECTHILPRQDFP